MNNESTSRPQNCGFTVIELLVVIAIIGILASMIIPGMSMLREQAQALDCASRMRTVGMALTAYTLDNRGRLPVPSTSMPTSSYAYDLNGLTSAAAQQTGGTPWNMAVYPYLGDAMGATTPVKYFACPLDKDETISPLRVYNQNGLIARGRRTFSLVGLAWYDGEVSRQNQVGSWWFANNSPYTVGSSRLATISGESFLLGETIQTEHNFFDSLWGASTFNVSVFRSNHGARYKLSDDTVRKANFICADGHLERKWFFEGDPSWSYTNKTDWKNLEVAFSVKGLFTTSAGD